MSIFQKKTSDIPSIFSHMFTKLPLITEKKSPWSKTFAQNFLNHVRKM